MRILFSHSYFLRFDAKQWRQQQPYPPLATIQAVAVVRNQNHEVALHDTMFEKSPDSLTIAIEKFNPDVFVIYDDGFNYLTKMCLTNMREAAFKMIEIAKQKKCLVVVSSSDSTDHTEKYLNAGGDFILIGEAENTLSELLKEIGTENFNPEKITGLAFKKDEKIIKTPLREIIKNLDELPLPAWDLVNIEPYKNAWLKSSGYFSINLNTTRGCPFKCNWCAKPIYGNRYNARSPLHVVEEIKYLKEKFNIQHIWFCDDIFGLKPGWVKTFSELVIKENCMVPFKIQCRADLLLQEENIKSLAQAGCDEVWIGAESGSQNILDAMDKGTTVSQIYEATRLLKKHGIKPCFFLQFGYPGETMSEINLTIKMVMELMPYHIGVSVSYPLPGTKFYDMVKDQLKTKANWSDSDELALMFKNTFPPAFYKTLHRYLHKSYRTKQSLITFKNVLSGNEKISMQAVRRISAMPYYFAGKILNSTYKNYPAV